MYDEIYHFSGIVLKIKRGLFLEVISFLDLSCECHISSSGCLSGISDLEGSIALLLHLGQKLWPFEAGMTFGRTIKS